MLRRVRVEALDFDWLFHEQNASTLLDILSETDNTRILTSKQIKLFVDLVWVHYQGAIIKFIFLPYMLYLLLISYLSGQLVGDFIDTLYKDMSDPTVQAEFAIIRAKSYLITSTITCLMICFASLEAGQMYNSGIQYFNDYWNCIDFASLIMNTSFLATFTMCMCFQNEFI